ncbi:hypothetical protein D3C83_41240 [compost metagenome]
MKNTKATLRPASAMNTIITPESTMLDMTMRLRPSVSERCPPIGLAASPATCITARHTPTANGE